MGQFKAGRHGRQFNTPGLRDAQGAGMDLATARRAIAAGRVIAAADAWETVTRAAERAADATESGPKARAVVVREAMLRAILGATAESRDAAAAMAWASLGDGGRAIRAALEAEADGHELSGVTRRLGRAVDETAAALEAEGW